MLWLSGSNLAFSTHNFDGTAARTLGVYDFNMWNNFVITNTNGTWKVYKNGIKINEVSASNTMGGSSKPLEIGNATLAGAPRPFDGKIDDVRIYDRALSGSEIARLAGIQNRALVAHYKLDGNAEDSSGNSLHGTATNMSWVNGVFNYAGDFSNSGKIETPSILISKSFTASMWINENLDSTSSNYIYWGRNGSSNNGFSIFTYINFIYFPNYDSSGNTIDCYRYTKIGINEWHHYTFVRDVDNMKLKIYRDSELWKQSNIPNGTIFEDTYKTTTMGYSLDWNGQIDDLRIYNYALSDSEIKKLAQPLILHYKFDDRREEATENLLTNTNFSTWTKTKNSGSYPTVILNYATSPNSKKEATYMFLPNDGTYPRIQFSWTPTAVIEHTFTIWLKGLNLNSKVQIYMLRVIPWSTAHLMQTINPIPLEWTKYTITFTPLDSTAHVIYIGSHDSAKNSELLMWGPQLEKKGHPTPFTTGVRSGVIIKDSSLSGNHGTVDLTTTPKWVSGEVSYGAMEFVNNDIIEGPSFNLINNLSFGGWFKLAGSGYDNYPRLVTMETFWGAFISSSHGKLGFYGSGVDAAFNNSPDLRDNKLHHFMVTYDNSSLKGYVDGLFVGSLTKIGGLTDSGSTKLTIGDRATQDRSFVGIIDDIRIYAKALSNSEILQIYNERSGQMRFNNSAESTINMTSSTGKIEIK